MVTMIQRSLSGLVNAMEYINIGTKTGNEHWHHPQQRHSPSPSPPLFVVSLVYFLWSFSFLRRRSPVVQSESEPEA
jgi:hypothetical protein